MKFPILRLMAGTALFAALSLPAFAHTMTQAELCMGGIGSNCTIGYATQIYGAPTKVERWDGDSVHIVSYDWGGFHVIGRVPLSDARPEVDNPVMGFIMKDNNLSTPSGIAVGQSYSQVLSRFGEASTTVSQGTGLTSYVYAFPTTGQTLSFNVNGQGIITEINFGSVL